MAGSEEANTDQEKCLGMEVAYMIELENIRRMGF